MAPNRPGGVRERVAAAIRLHAIQGYLHAPQIPTPRSAWPVFLLNVEAMSTTGEGAPEVSEPHPPL